MYHIYSYLKKRTTRVLLTALHRFAGCEEIGVWGHEEGQSTNSNVHTLIRIDVNSMHSENAYVKVNPICYPSQAQSHELFHYS